MILPKAFALLASKEALADHLGGIEPEHPGAEDVSRAVFEVHVHAGFRHCTDIGIASIDPHLDTTQLRGRNDTVDADGVDERLQRRIVVSGLRLV